MAIHANPRSKPWRSACRSWRPGRRSTMHPPPPLTRQWPSCRQRWGGRRGGKGAGARWGAFGHRRAAVGCCGVARRWHGRRCRLGPRPTGGARRAGARWGRRLFGGSRAKVLPTSRGMTPPVWSPHGWNHGPHPLRPEVTPAPHRPRPNPRHSFHRWRSSRGSTRRPPRRWRRRAAARAARRGPARRRGGRLRRRRSSWLRRRWGGPRSAALAAPGHGWRSIDLDGGVASPWPR